MGVLWGDKWLLRLGNGKQDSETTIFVSTVLFHSYFFCLCFSIEEAKKAEEKKKAEEAQKAEEQKKAEEAKKAEVHHLCQMIYREKIHKTSILNNRS